MAEALAKGSAFDSLHDRITGDKGNVKQFFMLNSLVTCVH